MNPYNIVRSFENAVADYAGSNYAVAVDTCSAALFLCCKYLNVGEVTIPSRTYPGVPCEIINAGGRVKFADVAWQGAYRLEPYQIIDSALRFRRGMYEPGMFHCLSFNLRKPIAIGRGGMILTDDPIAAGWFKRARYAGRNECHFLEDTFDMIGWNMKMEPERAARGLQILQVLGDTVIEDIPVHYPDLSKFPVYEAANR